ncbi:hypothetical protein RUM43_010401 [Polyplax serrata]|uniref:Uncharacterized protein n=1 Tax=Polyplax serrata TaxID=468196 RepID=A0AAN8P0B6_POLSC
MFLVCCPQKIRGLRQNNKGIPLGAITQAKGEKLKRYQPGEASCSSIMRWDYHPHSLAPPAPPWNDDVPGVRRLSTRISELFETEIVHAEYELLVLEFCRSTPAESNKHIGVPLNLSNIILF